MSYQRVPFEGKVPKTRKRTFRVGVQVKIHTPPPNGFHNLSVEHDFWHIAWWMDGNCIISRRLHPKLDKLLRINNGSS